MQRQPVKSSNVKSVGYDPASQMLEVEFTTGSVYQYPKVSGKEYETLIGADSVGRTLNTLIKPNRTVTRIDAG